MKIALETQSPLSGQALRGLARETLRRTLQRMMTHDRVFWKIPEIRHRFDARWGRHFHMGPELFVQVSGISAMTFPHQTLRLGPGGILLVPRGIPHEERIESNDRRDPFRNLVFMYSGRHVHVHAGEPRDGSVYPEGGKSQTLGCEPAEDPARYLNDAAMLSQLGTARADPAIRGLLIAHLACLLRGLEMPEPTDEGQSGLILNCHRYINQRLANPQLSVQTLASWISCSPDYLSHRFRKATGRRLARFIHEQRIGQAKTLLSGVTMNISEVARACGYPDPGHFSRIFKQCAGMSPREWRKSRLRDRI